MEVVPAEEEEDPIRPLETLVSQVQEAVDEVVSLDCCPVVEPAVAVAAVVAVVDAAVVAFAVD